MQEFRDDFIKLWNENGGLITKATAGKILDLSTAEICRKVKLNMIHEFKIPNQKISYLSFSEVIKLKRKRKRQQKAHKA